jgi:uncharacterized protein (TIGR02678 family)
MSSTLEQRAEEERRTATRALLAEPFVGADDDRFPLVRRHERELARFFAHVLGYRLLVTPAFARLFKRPTADARSRAWRIRPGSASGRARPVDEWPALDRRRAVLLLLTVAALEREGQQTVVGELARRVAEAGARCDPPLRVDFEVRAERLAFADALDLLCAWGVAQVVDGSRRSFSRAHADEDEALLTIERRRLAAVLRDPFAALAAGSLDDLLDERDDYPPTQDGETARTRHRVARRLVEDPVIYLDELPEAERAYLANPSRWLRDTVERWTGLRVERRAEGVAAIEASRELTDVAFPANATVKQVALLLCERLAALADVLPLTAVRDEVRALVSRHGAHWSRSGDDAHEVEQLTADALAVLAAHRLLDVEPAGVRVRPACGRFRTAQVRRLGEPA